MKKRTGTALFLFVLTASCAVGGGHHVTLKPGDARNDPAYLGYTFETKRYEETVHLTITLDSAASAAFRSAAVHIADTNGKKLFSGALAAAERKGGTTQLSFTVSHATRVNSWIMVDSDRIEGRKLPGNFVGFRINLKDIQ